MVTVRQRGTYKEVYESVLKQQFFDNISNYYYSNCDVQCLKCLVCVYSFNAVEERHTAAVMMRSLIDISGVKDTAAVMKNHQQQQKTPQH